MNQNKDIRQIYFLFFAVSHILSYNLYLFGHNLLKCRTIAEGLIFTKSGLQSTEFSKLDTMQQTKCYKFFHIH